MNDAHVKISPRPITELERESIAALSDQIDEFRQVLGDAMTRMNSTIRPSASIEETLARLHWLSAEMQFLLCQATAITSASVMSESNNAQSEPTGLRRSVNHHCSCQSERPAHSMPLAERSEHLEATDQSLDHPHRTSCHCGATGTRPHVVELKVPFDSSSPVGGSSNPHPTGEGPTTSSELEDEA